MKKPGVFLLWVPLVSLLWGLAAFAAPRPLLAQEEEYVVQPGETLSEIAKAHGTDVETLRRLNNLGNANLVRVGQRLVLPAPAGESTTPARERRSSETATTIYIVQPGDSLSTVAAAHRTSVAWLVEFNQISPAQRLYIGQALVVPLAEAGAAASTQATAGAEMQIHIVQRGEHLEAIAAQYGTTAAALARANQLGDASLIRPGQRLVIVPPGFAETAGDVVAGSDGYHRHTTFPPGNEKWIDVDLSEQRVVAYEGSKAVKAFIISSGLPGTPTVTGTFRIWAKTPIQDMFGGNRASGTSYYLEDVQWVQYFYQDYSFHGAYWHNNFGRPMSRGCINMRNEDAQWLFDWASPAMTGEGWLFSNDTNPGTLVVIHE
jgi:LysM repeat protein